MGTETTFVAKHKKITLSVGRFFGIAKHQNTAKLLHPKHTSFGALTVGLLLLTPLFGSSGGGVLGAHTAPANEVITAKEQETSPVKSAIIASPKPGFVHQKIITVDGTCGTGLIVKLFNNNIFAGSAICTDKGTFSLKISLFTGHNDLRVANYDNLDQPGPLSPAVTVTFVATSSTPQSESKNLLFGADYHVRNIDAEQTANWTFSIKLGKVPYKLTFDWGDNSKQTLMVKKDGNFIASHSYQYPGIYKISVNITDRVGAISFIQLVVTVNDQPATKTPVIGSADQQTSCQKALDQQIGLTLMRCRFQQVLGQSGIVIFWLSIVTLASFWFGSLYKKHQYNKLPKTPTVTHAQ